MSVITMDAIHTSRTYGGSYEGRVPKEDMLKICHNRAEKAFGSDRPIYLAGTYEGENLPEWHNIAWLHSDSKTDPSADGSHLVIHWLTDKWSERFELLDILEKVDWNAHAKDYWF